MKKQNLINLYSEWEKWSLTASHLENGWQSDFPMWDDLMNAAIEVMKIPDLSDREIEVLENCWAISEESEELLEYASENTEKCWSTIVLLAKSKQPSCRWQIYEAASFIGKNSEFLLRNGLEDSDSYSRRRAILALAKLDIIDAKDLAEKFSKDQDPYIRQAALEFTRKIHG